MADSKLTREEINELRKLIHELDIEMDAVQFNKLLETGEAAKSFLKSLRYQAGELNRELSSLAGHISDTVKELRKSESGAFNITKSYREIDDIGRQILNHQKGYNQMSADDADLLVTKLRYEKKRLEDLQKQYKLEEEFLEKKKKENDDLEEKLKEEIKDLETKSKLNKEEEKLLKEKKGLLNEVVDKNSNIPELLIANKEAHEQINKLLGEENHKYKTLVDYAKQIRSEQESLERAIGVTGAALDSIGAGFEKIGLGSLADRIGLDKAKNRMKEFANYITDGGKKTAGLIDQFRILSVGIGSLGKSILKNLTDPLVMAGLAAKGVQKGVGLIKLGFSSVLGFVKNLWGMADSFAAVFEKYAKAGQFAAQNFSAVGGQVNAITSGLNAAAAADPFMRVAEAGPALKAIVDGTGMMTTQMTKSVKEAHDLSYWLGYSAEETGKLYKLGGLNNQSAKETLIDIKARGVALNSQYKTSIDLRRVEQTALKASSAVTYNLKQNPKAIADAAFHATKLNMTLDEIASAAEQTLNFESSIQDQLTYQAMSGKEINIDAYQQAALRGDTVTSARELNNLIAKHGPGLKNNVLLQEAFAKSVGIGKDKLLEAMTATDLARKMGKDRNKVEEQLQALQRKGLTLEQASNELSKEGLEGSLAKSKRAEAMSRSLEDFRDYMATRLWPLFKAVFSPANIKMFMSVISGMRPVFVELGKAITAFFSPKSAGAMTDIIKNDVMPAILDMAKMLTEVAGVAGEALFGVIQALGPIIKKDIIPIFKMLGGIIRDLAPTVGTLIKAFAGGLAKVFSKIGEHKEDIKSFIETLAKGLTNVFSFVADHLKEIAITLVAFKAVTAVRSLKSAILGSPGSSFANPMYVKNVSVPGGGEGGILDKIKGLFGGGTKAAETAGATAAATTGGAAAPLASTVSKTASTTPPPTALPQGVKYDKAGRLQYEKGNELGKKGLVSKADAEKLGVSRTMTPTLDIGSQAVDEKKATTKRKPKAPKVSSTDITSEAVDEKKTSIKRKPKVPKAPKIGPVGDISKAASGADEGVSKSGSKLSKFGGGLDKSAGGMLKGAAAIAILAGALFIAAKAFQEFAKVKWESVAKGAAALGILGIAAYGLSKIEKDIIKGAASIGILAASLYIAAKSFQEFAKVQWDGISKGLVVLGGLAITASALGKAGSSMIQGAGAVAILGASLYIAAKGIQEFANVNQEDVIKAGVTLLGLTGALKLVSKSSGDLIKGAGALAIIAASLYIAAKGIQEFSMVEPEDMAKAGVALLGLGGAVIGLSRLMGSASGDLIKGGAAMVLMAGALYVTAKAAKEFSDVKWEDMGKAGAALGGLAIAAIVLGKAGPQVLVGSAAMIVMAGALYVTAKAVKEFSDVKWEDMGKAGVALLALTGAVIGLGAAMMSGIGAVAIMLGVGAMIAMGGALYVVAEGIKSLQEAVGGGKLDTLGADLGKGLTAITTGLQDVDFDDLIDTFDLLEDAFDELDIDQLLAFSQLASAKLGDAATNLIDGIKQLTNMGGEGGGSDIDFTKFAESLKTRLAPLEDVNSIFEDVIEELNLEELQQLSQISGEGIKNAIGGLMGAIKSITEMDFGGLELDSLFGDSITSMLLDIEDVFNALDDAIAEINFDNLKKFGDSVGVNLGAAARNIVTGINEMAQITTPVETVSGSVKEAFRQFNIIMSGLNVSAFTAFAELAKTDLGKAMNSFISSLQNVGQSIGPTTFSNAEEIKKAFKDFNTAIASLQIEPGPMGTGGDGLLAFAKLADVNLSQAAVNIKAGMDKLKEEFEKIDKTASQYDFTNVKNAFIKLNTVVKDIDLEAFKKLGDLATAEIGEGAKKIKAGLDGVRDQFGSLDAKYFDFLTTNVQPIFEKIAVVFGKDSKASQSIATLEAFAKADFSKFKDTILGFKNGLMEFEKLKEIPEDLFKADGAVAKLFTAVNSIFNPQGGLNIENLIKFGTADFSKFGTSVKGFKAGLLALRDMSNELAGFDGTTISTLLTNISKSFVDQNIKNLVDFATKDLSKFPENIKHIKTAVDKLNEINYKNDFSTLNAFIKNITDAITTISYAKSSIETFVTIDFVKFTTSLTSFKSALDILGTLVAPAELGQTMLNIKTAFENLGDASVFKSFSEINGDALYQVSEKVASSIEKLSAITLSEGVLETILSSFSDGISELDIDELNELAALNISNLPFVAKAIQDFISIAETIVASSPETIFEQIEDSLDAFNSAIGVLDVEQLKQLSEIISSNLTATSISIKDAINNWANLTVNKDLETNLATFADAIAELDANQLTNLSNANTSNLKSNAEAIKLATDVINTISVAEATVTSFQNLSNVLGTLNTQQLSALNEVKTENLLTNFTNIKNSFAQFENAADITPTIKMFYAFHKVLGAFFKADYSKSTVVSTIQELTKIDTTKLDTLKTSIDNLSISFKGFGETIKGIGDLKPIVTITTQMLKMQETISKNPVKDPEKLAENVGAIFSGLMGSLVSFVEGGGEGVSNSFLKGATAPKFAEGGIITKRIDNATIGEAGPEAVIPLESPIGREILNVNPKSTSNTNTTVEYSALLEEFREFRKMMASNKDQPIVINTQLNLDGEVVAKNTEEKLRTRRQRI